MLLIDIKSVLKQNHYNDFVSIHFLYQLKAQGVYGNKVIDMLASVRTTWLNRWLNGRRNKTRLLYVVQFNL